MKETEKAELRSILKDMDDLIIGVKSSWNDEAGTVFTKLLGDEYEDLQAFLRASEMNEEQADE